MRRICPRKLDRFFENGFSDEDGIVAGKIAQQPTPPTAGDTPLSVGHETYSCRSIRRWRARGRPVPPPHAVKRALLRRLQRHLKTNLLVETGTYYGDMISDLSGEFGRVVRSN